MLEKVYKLNSGEYKYEDGDIYNKDDYILNTIVEMKKPHPCGTNEWEIIRIGADIKIKCINCGRSIMMPRIEFNKKLKKVVNYQEEKMKKKKKKKQIKGPVSTILFLTSSKSSIKLFAKPSLKTKPS